MQVSPSEATKKKAIKAPKADKDNDKVLHLTNRAVKKVVEVENPQTIKSESFFLQVLNLKEFDTPKDAKEDNKKTVKLRFHLSDGESTVLAMMNKQVYDKLEGPIANFDVIQVYSFLKQSIKERTILVLTKAPKVIYNTIKSKIGSPKDYADNQKENVFASACPKPKTVIPKSAI
jgi:hypothetical protein